MNPCQGCHEREATVHFTQIVNDTVTTMHLCGRCAAERGIATPASGGGDPLGSMLATLGSTIPEAPGREPLSVCADCGATLSDIRASGRLGCASCWTTFARPLRDLVRRVHGSAQHVGAWYDDPAAGPEASGLRVAHERTRLREALREAVEGEAFEDAAELRDRLRALGPE